MSKHNVMDSYEEAPDEIELIDAVCILLYNQRYYYTSRMLSIMGEREQVCGELVEEKVYLIRWDTNV